MSQKEEQIMQKLGNVIPTMPEEKKEYFAGVADGIALMSNPQKQDEQAEKDD